MVALLTFETRLVGRMRRILTPLSELRPDALCFSSCHHRHKSQIMLTKIKQRSEEGHFRVLTFLWDATQCAWSIAMQ
jgi:hypothetical protein